MSLQFKDFSLKYLHEVKIKINNIELLHTAIEFYPPFVSRKFLTLLQPLENFKITVYDFLAKKLWEKFTVKHS